MPARQLVRSDSWLDSVGDSFARSLAEDYSPKTIRNYGIGIKNFFAFLRENGVDDLVQLDRDLIERWQASLRERTPRPLKSSSRSLYGTAVRQLIRYAADCDIVDLKLERAVRGVRRRRRDDDEGDGERQAISEGDLEVLKAWFGPRRPRMRLIDLRDRALFYFLLDTGLRVSEALQVLRDNFAKGRVRQKGGAFVDFELAPTSALIVSEYVRERVDDEPWLWIRIGNNWNVGGVLEDSGVREIWRRHCQRLGIERFTTHQLRHTSATILLENDVDHVVVADHMHHADLRTVKRYTKVRRKLKQRAIDAMDQFLQAGSRPRLLPKVGRRGYGR